ncbi:MAG: Osmotically-inducible putative lipoprotein OsmE [Candidatus Erwinia impunctatus]|nr:Osmotically-inducible putative lipoprotein OsmE [Culicoides impunctatus]
MKEMAAALIAVLLCLLQTGCSAHDQPANDSKYSVMGSVKKGMSREMVKERAGLPATEITMLFAKGTCQTYLIRGQDGEQMTYFVSYNDSGKVINYGFQSCSEYDVNPDFTS